MIINKQSNTAASGMDGMDVILILQQLNQLQTVSGNANSINSKIILHNNKYV